MVDLGNLKLECINKPARYVGGEVNQVIKKDAKFNVVLCYPNLYEKAMSNYYVNLLYSNINGIKDIFCTRCFAPDLDFEKALRDNKYKLYSLENYREISENDIILFVIDNEFNITNLINMLNISKIEMNKNGRKKSDPKIVLFSLNSVNIKPIMDFADVVFDNNEEKENIKELLAYLKNYSNYKANAKQLKDDDNIDVLYPIDSIVPSIKIDDESIIIDLEQVDSIEETIEFIKKCIKARGVTRVSFINQARISEFKFCELIYKIKANIEEIKISPKKLDFNYFTKEMLDIVLPCLEKSSLTFNVVTCSNKLINKYNIGVKRNDLLEKIKYVFKNNRNSIKLIFNIGIPEETYEDIDDIFAISEEIVNMYSQRKAKDKLSIIVDIKCYIPDIDDKYLYSINNINKLETKVRYIKEKKSDYVIKYNVENADKYIIKVMLKNGNSNITNVICSAYDHGARFDLDDLKYNKSAWDKAIYDNINITKKYSNIE